MIEMTDREQLKEIVKESLSELFDQKRDYFVSVLTEVLEDKAMLAAIKAGENGDSVSREDVFAELSA